MRKIPAIHKTDADFIIVIHIFEHRTFNTEHRVTKTRTRSRV